MAALGLRCGMPASHCGGFSCCGARAWPSVVVARGLSSCGSQALEQSLSNCGAWASLLHSMWDLPGPGLEPVSPALAGGFLTTAPPGKSLTAVFKLASGHPGLEIKILYYCTLCSTVEYTKAQPLVEDAHT